MLHQITVSLFVLTECGQSAGQHDAGHPHGLLHSLHQRLRPRLRVSSLFTFIQGWSRIFAKSNKMMASPLQFFNPRASSGSLMGDFKKNLTLFSYFPISLFAQIIVFIQQAVLLHSKQAQYHCLAPTRNDVY